MPVRDLLVRLALVGGIERGEQCPAFGAGQAWGAGQRSGEELQGAIGVKGAIRNPIL
ncbi:hypothetical protein [Mycolicibacter minnesotensis]|uniref:hypothetical protein n=1 Tax=Mycolicibacter minnesotensis TaxID=1118379 RepID=UPI001C6588D0|nr:hypothetical protein [Mycolicibacter minnesotensis]